MDKKREYRRMNYATRDEVLAALRLLQSGKRTSDRQQDKPIQRGLFSEDFRSKSK